MGNALNEMREQIVEHMLYGLSQGLTVEQYARLKAHLLAMPEAEFTQLLAEAKFMAGQSHITAKEYNEQLMELGKRNGVNSENAAINAIPIEFLPSAQCEAVWNDICRTKPSDRVCLKTEDDRAICSLWEKRCSLPAGSIPSDLFFAGKIPLLDCEIVVDETSDPGGVLYEYRVVVFTDYQERIRESRGVPVQVGASVYKLNGFTFFTPICVCEGVDVLMNDLTGYHNVSAIELSRCRVVWTKGHITNINYQLLATWYGIQVALLHPTVRDVFRNPVSVPVYASGGKKKKHRRVVRYVRQHVINAESLRAANGSGRDFERHTLVWYVIGHWRHYNNGKRVFVQPYWKGALREVKMSLDDRDREIVYRPE